jgi:hypothetical protein
MVVAGLAGTSAAMLQTAFTEAPLWAGQAQLVLPLACGGIGFALRKGCEACTSLLRLRRAAVRNGSEAVKLLNSTLFAFVFSAIYRRKNRIFPIISQLLRLSVGAGKFNFFSDEAAPRRGRRSLAETKRVGGTRHGKAEPFRTAVGGAANKYALYGLGSIVGAGLVLPNCSAMGRKQVIFASLRATGLHQDVKSAQQASVGCCAKRLGVL